MPQLKSWALSVCICCILLSFLEASLPAKKTAHVIKLVTGLYILIILATPFLSFLQKLPELEVQPFGEASVSQIDTSASVLASAEKNLEAAITQELKKEGVEPKEVLATLTYKTDTELSAQKVEVLLPKGQDLQKASRTVHALFPAETEITISEE